MNIINSVIDFLFHTREGKAALIGLAGSMLSACMILRTIAYSRNQDRMNHRGDTYVKMIEPILGKLTHMALYVSPKHIDSFLTSHFPTSRVAIGADIHKAMSERLSNYGRDSFINLISKFRLELGSGKIAPVKILKLAILHIQHGSEQSKQDPLFGPYVLAIEDVFKEFTLYTIEHQNPDELVVIANDTWKWMIKNTSIVCEQERLQLMHHLIRATYIDMGEIVLFQVFRILPDPKRQEAKDHRDRAQFIINNSRYKNLLHQYATLMLPAIELSYERRIRVAIKKLRNNMSLPKGDTTYNNNWNELTSK